MNNGIIGQRINEALAFRNVKQKELAKELGVKDNVVSYWCSGTRTPNVQQIMQISKILNVSADYLTGISEAKTNNIELKAICDYTGLTEDVIENFHAMLVEEDEENENIIDSKFINDFLSSTLFCKMILFNRNLDRLEKSLLYHLSIFFEDEKTTKKIKDELDYIQPITVETLNQRELILYKNQKSVNTYFEQLTELLSEISTHNLDEYCLVADMLLSENHTYSDLSNDDLIATDSRFNELLNKLKYNDMQKYSELKEIYERYKDE